MGNLGKVKVKVTFGGTMTGVTSTDWTSVHDLPSGDAYEFYSKRLEGPPKNIEFIQEPLGGGYLVVPKRNYKTVANYIDGVSSSTSLASPRIIWKVLTKGAGPDVSSCVGTSPCKISDLITNKTLEIVAPGSYTNSYIGPRWNNTRGVRQVLPATAAAPPANSTPDATTPPPTPTADDFSTAYVSQENICEDIWWSIETASLGSSEKGTPFFVDVRFQRPLAQKQPTFFALRIGNLSSGNSSQSSATSTQGIIELIFVDGKPSELHDWGIMQTASGGGSEPVVASIPGSMTWGGAWNRIGFTPMAGRLCISVNGSDYLYTRINTGDSSGPNAATGETSSTDGAKLIFPDLTSIRAIGSNSMATINLGTIVFPASASFHTNLPGGFNPTTGASDSALSGSVSGLPPSGGSSSGGTSTSLVGMPDNKSNGITLGAFAKDCDGQNLSAEDSWGAAASGNMHGSVNFELSQNSASGSPSGTANKHYQIKLSAETASFGEGTTATNDPILPPVWFRARGCSTVSVTNPGAQNETVADDDVMSLSESFSSPDRAHVIHSIDIVLYNENGQYDDICEKSVPVMVKYGWNSVTSPCFVGVTLSSSRSMTAGKETISIHCEDYMFILDSTLVINSPYYDGMDGFNVVRDLISRAGLSALDETGSGAGDRFFVPSAYSFLAPVKRYDPKSSIKSAVLDVCSMGTKVVWFDSDGSLHYDHVQGGIANTSPQSSVGAVANFYSDPSAAADEGEIILDEKRTETKLNSTVNRIFVKSIDRVTRATIMMSATAPAANNKLAYFKTMYASVPSLGSFDAVTLYIERYKAKVFKPIRGITIKTTTSKSITPMKYISVDGQKFRVMGVNRAINVEDNSITTSITGEWYGDF